MEVGVNHRPLSFRGERSESLEPMNTVGAKEGRTLSRLRSLKSVVFMGSGLGFAAPE